MYSFSYENFQRKNMIFQLYVQHNNIYLTLFDVESMNLSWRRTQKKAFSKNIRCPFQDWQIVNKSISLYTKKQRCIIFVLHKSHLPKRNDVKTRDKNFLRMQCLLLKRWWSTLSHFNSLLFFIIKYRIN